MPLHQYIVVDKTTGKPIETVTLDPMEEEVPDDHVIGWDEEQTFYNPTYNFEKRLWEEGEFVGEALESYKQAKIVTVNSICNQAILDGFLSPSLGFYFEFEQHDQDNFTQQAIILNIDETVTEVAWKTKDEGIKMLTREQFFTLLKESEAHKRRNIGKYWQLKTLIEQATTREEVDAINW